MNLSNTTDAGDTSFEAFIERLQGGDESAAAELFANYSNRLVALARSRMSKQLQRKVDAEDVLQSVMRSFFVRQEAGMFELTSWEGLWGLLVRITLRKCGRNLERFHTGARDIRKESSPQADEDSSLLAWQALARDPTPGEAVQLSDTLEQLLRSINDSDSQQILELRLQGYSIAEISDQMGCVERTVLRKLKLIRERLAKIVDVDQSE